MYILIVYYCSSCLFVSNLFVFFLDNEMSNIKKCEEANDKTNKLALKFIAFFSNIYGIIKICKEFYNMGTIDLFVNCFCYLAMFMSIIDTPRGIIIGILSIIKKSKEIK